jgi:aminoglycoside phosphotransferase family enzyme/predicted kinase
VATLQHDLLAQGMQLRQTHISQVFLSETRAYKVKKAVALGFLDFSTLAQRRHFCEAEVELNRRLAPNVYRGVVAITRDADGVHRIAAIGETRETGETVEWAVEMQRLPDRDAADRRLAEGRLDRSHMRLLAERIADFHANARCDAETAQFGTAEAIAANVRENFAQTRTSAPKHLAATELAAIERFQLEFVHAQRQLLSARVAAQRVRDGHGDLRLEHCYLSDAGNLQIIDCIEFSPRFRYADVCADVAFLAMDLTFHGRHDLSEAFLADYARASGDYDAYALVDFYESYRAYVRAKVSGMLEEDTKVEPALRVRAGADARKYFLLAEASARPALEAPALYAVGGLLGSGKSTVAERLADIVHAPIVDADRTRKRLFGVAPTTPLHDPAFVGHYSDEATARVYGELLRTAEVILRSGRSVVLDATFAERGRRGAVLDLARRAGVPFRFFECSAPPGLCRQRLAERARTAGVSDGRVEIFDAFAARFEPADELPADVRVRFETTRSLDELDAALRAAVG